jgi:chromosome segregation ATPase
MEENFTQEALQAEAREDKLRRQLMASEEANSQYSSTTAAQHEFYIDQVETLKEENSLAWSKIHDYEENVGTLNHENGTLQEQVNKLQSVLINYETGA